MSRENANAIIEEAVRQICDGEIQKLNYLYSLPLEELGIREKNELIKMSINLPVDAQEKMQTALKNAGVPYVHSAWQKISEKLPEISYTYIDWNSFDNVRRKDYEIEVLPDDYEKAKAGMPITVAAGCLIAGSIALICLKPIGSSVKILVAFVVMATSGGYAITRVLNKNPSAQPADADRKPAVINAAKNENIEIVKQWCCTLEDVTNEIAEAKR